MPGAPTHGNPASTELPGLGAGQVDGVMAALAACPRLAAMAAKVQANTDFVRRGEQLADHRQLELGPFKPVAVGDHWSWESDPLRDRSWQWRLNWLSFISYLVAHHAATGHAPALAMAVQAAQSWLEHFGHRHSRRAFEFAWHDHGTALRAEQLALLLHYLEANRLWADAGGAAARETLARACVHHVELLGGENFFSRHTNHGLEQARVLLLIALALRPALPGEAGRWVDVAAQRLDGELRHAFTDEGVHVENSPAYHVFVFKVFLGIVGSFSDSGLETLAAWQRDVGPRALEFLTRMIRPDLTLPIIGDTEAIPVTDSFAGPFGGTPAYEEFQFVQSAGARGRRPKSLHRVYPLSGYAIFRSDWNTGEEFSRSFHLVFKAGAISRYHRQQDDGHFVVVDDGEDWLIDSGLYNYDQKSPVRQYMRSRQGHNVWLTERPTQDARDIPADSIWRVISFREDGPLPYVQAESRAYLGLRMVRRVSIFRRRCFRVDDVLAAEDGVAAEAESLWHVPADKLIEVRGEREIVIRSKKTGRQLTVTVHGDAPAHIRVLRGSAKSRVTSVVSTQAGASKDSQVISMTFAAALSVVTSLEFVFEDAGA